MLLMVRQMAMKRILILGCCGSGKTSFARQLHAATQIPLIHLDREYWLPNWTEPPREEWNRIVADLVQRETWIMDGNYSSSIHTRVPRADTIILLDRSTQTCFLRVCKRVFSNYGKVRPDMSEGCVERFYFGFMHYVLMFNLRNRKMLLHLVETQKHEKRTYVFRKEDEINTFLERLTG